MACLRESSLEGRSGALQCDEEGCKFRLFKTSDGSELTPLSPETDCVLQLRLRTGDSEEPCYESNPDGSIAWDLNVPMYTRDFLRLQKEGKLTVRIGNKKIICAINVDPIDRKQSRGEL